MRGRPIAVGVLLALVATAIVVAQSSSGRSLLHRADVEQSPTAFAQLYFSRPNQLPSRVTPPGARERVTFIVVNDERRTRTFRWSITTRGSTAAAHGQLSLRVGRSRTIARTVAIRCTARRVYETVTLATPHESIGYWQTCPASDGRPAPATSTASHG